MINERLSEAAEEIFALFEQSVAEYQREIDRLKKASEPKNIQVQQIVSPDTLLIDENTGSFHCKEEPEQVIITRADEPQMLITNIKSLKNRDDVQPHGQQQKANSEGPEASGGAETNNNAESNPEAEEEDSDTGNDEYSLGSDVTMKAFSSSVCKKGLRQTREMLMRTVHTDTGEEPLTSAECYAQLDSEQHSPLQPDMESTEARPFSCTVCDRRFKQMICLQAHMKEHNGQSLFKCTECSVAFTKQAKFFRHMKTVHSIDKPFKCSVCNKCLKTAHAYRTHMLIHTGERPFKCSVCGRGFVQKVSLKNHMVTHTGEKPFTCTECGKNYATSQSLMIHNRLIHR